MACVALVRAAGVQTTMSASLRPGACCAEMRAARIGASRLLCSSLLATPTTCQVSGGELIAQHWVHRPVSVAHLVTKSCIGTQDERPALAVVWAAAA